MYSGIFYLNRAAHYVMGTGAWIQDTATGTMAYVAARNASTADIQGTDKITRAAPNTSTTHYTVRWAATLVLARLGCYLIGAPATLAVGAVYQFCCALTDRAPLVHQIPISPQVLYAMRCLSLKNEAGETEPSKWRQDVQALLRDAPLDRRLNIIQQMLLSDPSLSPQQQQHIQQLLRDAPLDRRLNIIQQVLSDPSLSLQRQQHIQILLRDIPSDRRLDTILQMLSVSLLHPQHSATTHDLAVAGFEKLLDIENGTFQSMAPDRSKELVQALLKTTPAQASLEDFLKYAFLLKQYDQACYEAVIAYVIRQLDDPSRVVKTDTLVALAAQLYPMLPPQVDTPSEQVSNLHSALERHLLRSSELSWRLFSTAERIKFARVCILLGLHSARYTYLENARDFIEQIMDVSEDAVRWDRRELLVSAGYCEYTPAALEGYSGQFLTAQEVQAEIGRLTTSIALEYEEEKKSWGENEALDRFVRAMFRLLEQTTNIPGLEPFSEHIKTSLFQVLDEQQKRALRHRHVPIDTLLLWYEQATSILIPKDAQKEVEDIRNKVRLLLKTAMDNEQTKSPSGLSQDSIVTKVIEIANRVGDYSFIEQMRQTYFVPIQEAQKAADVRAAAADKIMDAERSRRYLLGTAMGVVRIALWYFGAP